MTYYVKTRHSPVHATVSEGDALGRWRDLPEDFAISYVKNGEDADIDSARANWISVCQYRRLRIATGARGSGVPVKMIVYKGFGTHRQAKAAARRNGANYEWFSRWIWARNLRKKASEGELSRH